VKGEPFIAARCQLDPRNANSPQGQAQRIAATKVCLEKQRSVRNQYSHARYRENQSIVEPMIAYFQDLRTRTEQTMDRTAEAMLEPQKGRVAQ
jgi:hypothetical protein